MDKVKQAGKWLPEDPGTLHKWLRRHHDGAGKREEPLHPAVRALQELVNCDGLCRMLLCRAMDQVDRDAVEHHFLDTPEDMVQAIDAVMDRAPEYSKEGPVCFPISAILTLTMGTPAGFEAYRNDKINACFKRILAVWCDFLSSGASRHVLHGGEDGWMCAHAREQLGMGDYEHDADAPHWGYVSWNDFFTRKLSGSGDPRPIAGRGDSSVVVAPCDSVVNRVARGVQYMTKFWLKSQPYSLLDMLGHRAEYARALAGGDVLQAYLSAMSYHRWHSPVSGRVVAAWNVDGTYFSELAADSPAHADPSPPRASQGYIAHVAARAVFIIEADDAAIGLVAFVAIGMAEVSSNVIREDLRRAPGEEAGASEPARVEKGDELGYFQFGGSTQCLVLRPGVVERFLVTEGDSIKVGQQVAAARTGASH